MYAQQHHHHHHHPSAAVQVHPRQYYQHLQHQQQLQQQHQQQQQQQQQALPTLPFRKSPVELFMCWLILGWLGAHHFYLGRIRWGFVYFFTLGLLGVGWVVDLFRLPSLYKDAKIEHEHRVAREIVPEPQTSLLFAYILWLNPLGVLGAHMFYVGKPLWGFIYFFTFGLLGVGWLTDLFMLPHLVREANSERRKEQYKAMMDATWAFPKESSFAISMALESSSEKTVWETAKLTLSPLGMLGLHHLYLGRVGWFFLYLFTFGLLGVGWLVDWFRIVWLVRNANSGAARRQRIWLHEAYMLWFPMGFLGLHHFYLRRHCWGLVYLLTFGGFGCFWLVDLFRLPSLVRAAVEDDELLQQILIVANSEQGTFAHYGTTPAAPSAAPSQSLPQSQLRSPSPPPAYTDAVAMGSASMATAVEASSALLLPSAPILDKSTPCSTAPILDEPLTNPPSSSEPYMAPANAAPSFDRCMHCYERPVATVAQPCGHSALCSSCATIASTQLDNRCPVCHQLVIKHVAL
ncbi:hypothetical protein CAOG_06335 [Capsaspora owczarzaki ATCC 30864]|uniref:RING-type domain-containing protein n=1 Tax=Capsaspora owczarzaki (strain ATCC 30864) TaxID=595528 RepID=A0A0D2VWJ4_CAPO3|nr:hypothetical protein CAOG_06335 [Capsaspora owczarzaki ATCC 30864]KJE95952.1 hypothetical protein CAOG_006335 [Capsaspora owczarzaki ATCC 30864]|eukprot:XP_004345084.1 hypothetical protein CAOG_06335 [Capsaspora owczarzaki ATCC 30864]